MKFKSTPEINLQNFVFICGQIPRTFFNMRHFNYVLITKTTKTQTCLAVPKICKFLPTEGRPGKVARRDEPRRDTHRISTFNVAYGKCEENRHPVLPSLASYFSFHWYSPTINIKFSIGNVFWSGLNGRSNSFHFMIAKNPNRLAEDWHLIVII